jgi:hypothetical protein
MVAADLNERSVQQERSGDDVPPWPVGSAPAVSGESTGGHTRQMANQGSGLGVVARPLEPNGLPAGPFRATAFHTVS